jgi:hypothetical protein
VGRKQGVAVDENLLNGVEFTDEQLRAALKRVGRDAREAAFAAGRPVVVIKDGSLVALYGDGTEEVIGPVRSEPGTAR